MNQIFYRIKKHPNKRKLPPPEDSFETDEDDDDDNSKDWWTKYFNSFEKLIELSKTGTTKLPENSEEKRKLNIKGSKLVQKLSPKHLKKPPTKTQALCHVSSPF